MFEVTRIMNCVEITEVIGKHFNLTLLTYQNMLSYIYENPSMKLVGRVSLVAVIVRWQVTDTVFEENF